MRTRRLGDYTVAVPGTQAEYAAKQLLHSRAKSDLGLCYFKGSPARLSLVARWGFGRCQSLCQAIGRAGKESGQIDTAAMRPVGQVACLVDVCDLPACSLGPDQKLERQGRLARGGQAHDLADLALGQTANVQGAIQIGKTGGNMSNGGGHY